MLINVKNFGFLLTHERKCRSMSKKNKKESDVSVTMKEIKISVISSLIVAIIVAGISSYTTIKVNEEKIKNIDKTVENINDSINTLTQSLNESDKILAAHSAMLEYLSHPSQTSGVGLKKVQFNNNIFSFTNNEDILSAPKFNNNYAVVDLETNQNYTISQLRNVSIITYYIENGNEIYFYGQYNENDCWNGLCILNVYKNNELVTIFEGIYNNGDLCSYKRVSCDNAEGWEVADRVDFNTYTTGEMRSYKKTKSYAQKISSDNLDTSLILTTDSFMEDLNERLLTYYSGKISDGSYNDDTGNAFWIKYFEDSEIKGIEGINAIKTLYKGKFADGYFYDNTNESWYIAREIDTKYMYYKGSFSNKTADNKNRSEFINPAEKDYIVQKLKENGLEKYKDEFYIDYE